MNLWDFLRFLGFSDFVTIRDNLNFFGVNHGFLDFFSDFLKNFMEFLWIFKKIFWIFDFFWFLDFLKVFEIFGFFFGVFGFWGFLLKLLWSLLNVTKVTTGEISSILYCSLKLHFFLCFHQKYIVVRLLCVFWPYY